MWNLTGKTNSRGNLICDLLDNSNITLLNTGAPTRWEDINQTATAIDLTLTSPDLATHTYWEIKEEDLGSDHKLIVSKIWSYHKFESDAKITVTNKENAIKYLNEINPKDLTDVNTMNEKIHEAIKKATYSFKRKKKVKTYRNENIKSLYKEKNKKHIDFRKNLTLENKREFKKAERKFQQALKKEVIKYRNKMLESINENTNTTQMWTIVRAISGNLKNKNNLEITNNDALAIEFMYDNFKEKNLNLTHIPDNNEKDKYNKPLSIENMLKNIKNEKDRSTAGEDKLSYYFLKTSTLNY